MQRHMFNQEEEKESQLRAGYEDIQILEKVHKCAMIRTHERVTYRRLSDHEIIWGYDTIGRFSHLY